MGIFFTVLGLILIAKQVNKGNDNKIMSIKANVTALQSKNAVSYVHLLSIAETSYKHTISLQATPSGVPRGGQRGARAPGATLGGR